MIVPFIAVSRNLLQNNCKPVQLQRNFHLPQFVRYRTQVLIDCKHLHSFRNGLSFGNLFNQLLQKTMPNLKRSSLLLILAKELKEAPKFIRDNSVCVFKSCIAQFEYVLAYRIRRGQQLFSLYTKLWDEMALKHFFQQIRRLAYRRGKEFLLGGATLAFDWKSEIISDEELKTHVNELKICRFLRDKINQDICSSSREVNQPEAVDVESCCWSPFIKQEDLIVWKKEEPNHKGLYCYKMYGKYVDVTARDFLAVFLDVDNRTKWDHHVVQLKVIDSEPSTNSDVIYWETKWPKLFSNRDYVFTRRFLIDESEKVMIVMNRSTSHPDYPVMQSKSRVTEYWSYIVIRPTSEFNQPGIEFSLTYFDNPGVSVPSAISLWVSSTVFQIRYSGVDMIRKSYSLFAKDSCPISFNGLND
ncbi:stAR-related lipid transfer protein 7, mitochondrial-like isoform X2 [Rhodnius prolixus]|uniref:stAR-related lipid transfer protein 7, mitochondrial-like isoform X2 n=1 Tax=Rhodnius prolixus TaxID=13249 RepID=UPI003D18D6B2